MGSATTAARRRWRWAGLFAAAGALGLGTELYLLREVLVALGGDETAVGLGLGAWLLGIALGAGAARALRGLRAGTLAAAGLGLLALAGWPAIVAARLGRGWLGVPAGELPSLGAALLLALGTFVLPGALVGGTFVALAAASTAAGDRDGQRAIGALYVAESLGSLAAGLLVSLVLVPLRPPLAGMALLAALALALALPAARGGLIAGRWALPLLVLGALGAAVAPPTARLEEWLQRARFGGLVRELPLLEWADTPYQSLAVGGGEVRALFASGEYVGSFPDPEADEARAHALMALAERPRRVLALGGVETGLLRFCLRHEPERLDLVLMDRGAFELVRRHLAPEDARALGDPRVRLWFEDPRRFLARAGEPYDLVLLLAPDPTTLLGARTTTLEFHRLVRARLDPRGVFVASFSAGANAQSGATGALGAALYRTLGAAFPVVRAAPGPPGLLVAGVDPDAVTLDPERLAARYRSRGLESEVFVPELFPVLFPPERVATLQRELAAGARELGPSRDERPRALLRALVRRQELGGSEGAALLAWGATHPGWLALATLAPSALAVLVVAARGRAAARLAAVHATLVTGAAGMALSLMLLFSYQARVGALYSELGALSGTFMLGLGLGGAWAARGRSLLAAALAATASAAVIGLALALLGALGPPLTGLGPAHAVLLLLAGAGTGAVFPAAAGALLAAGRDTRRAAAAIELADHAGAALAALAAPLLLVPVLGLGASAGLVAGLCALGALGVGSARPARRGVGASRRTTPA